MSYQNFPLTEHIGLLSAFPATLEVDSSSPQRLTRKLTTTSPAEDTIAPCLHLLKLTIGELYTKHKGKDWVADKIEEMLEDGLVYVRYYNSEKRLVAFVSFVLTEDEGVLMVYLYEIHIHPEYHGLRIGSALMKSLHEFVSTTKQAGVIIDDVDMSNIVSTKLTVFTDNLKALNWYKGMGYQLSPDSPRDRTLRSGKVVKPDYYLLERPV